MPVNQEVVTIPEDTSTPTKVTEGVTTPAATELAEGSANVEGTTPKHSAPCSQRGSGKARCDMVSPFPLHRRWSEREDTVELERAKLLR